ncbi:MAG: hypothetical protein AB7K86_12210 [Rhodospirillales bacterium]
MQHDDAAAGGLVEWARLIEASAAGAMMRESFWLYPVMNLTHLLGLVMLVGGIGLLDLRLLGFGRSVPAAALSRYVTPIAVAGLVLMIGSGAMQFAADAGALAGADVFRLKIVIVAAAIANAVLFRLLWRRRLRNWDAAPPAFGRLQAAASVSMWIAAGTLGRLIAYY